MSIIKNSQMKYENRFVGATCCGECIEAIQYYKIGENNWIDSEAAWNQNNNSSKNKIADVGASTAITTKTVALTAGYLR